MSICVYKPCASEIFETENGEEIPAGYSVCLGKDEKVRVADPDDPLDVPIGVICNVNFSPKNDSSWHGKYLRSPLGDLLYDERQERKGEDAVKDRYQTMIENVETGYLSGLFSKSVEEQVSDLTEKMEQELAELEIQTIREEKLNPDFDPEREYIPRRDRPEWVVVGLVGKVPLLKGQATNSNWHKIRDIDQDVELWLIK